MNTEAIKRGQRPLDLSLVGAEHVRRYLETDGEVGHDWNGVSCLVLTTHGKRSAQPRSQALIYGRDGNRYIVVASMGGAPRHPHWYPNLVAEPRCQVQIRGDRFQAVARTAVGQERERLWRIMALLWPSYDEYVTRTTREIPVVMLERS